MKTLIKLLFRKQLVSFGNYLLSSKRDSTIKNEVNKKSVGHWDIENW